MRGRHGQFPQYHTSADNLSFIDPARLGESLRVLTDILSALEGNQTYLNLAPCGEPQLGSRGLYRALGGTSIADMQLALLWVLNLSDARHTLLDIAERAHMPFSTIRTAADLLFQHGLLSQQPTPKPDRA
jgi:aminopeptidase-like protein